MLDKFVEAEVLTAPEALLYSRNIQLARHRAVLAFRTILEVNCLAPIINSDSSCDRVELLEDFFSIFTTILQERTFLLDYNARYPIRDDFEIFEQSGILVDPTRKHYILDALCESVQGSVFSIVQKGEKEKKPSPEIPTLEPSSLHS